jgi:hypothetical protein
MNSVLVPATFTVPQLLETHRLRIRPLTMSDVVKDYDAVMTSVEHLSGVFGPDSKWPSPTMTFEQDLIDLGWHQKEFQRRSSFAYTVFSPDETRCLGCVYIYPSRNPDFDVMVIAWVRRSELAVGLDEHLIETTKKWLSSSWPFKNPGFPGRDVSWKDWKAGCVTSQ